MITYTNINKLYDYCRESRLVVLMPCNVTRDYYEVANCYRAILDNKGIPTHKFLEFKILKHEHNWLVLISKKGIKMTKNEYDALMKWISETDKVCTLSKFIG